MSAIRFTSPIGRAVSVNYAETKSPSLKCCWAITILPKCSHSKYYWSAPINYILGRRRRQEPNLFDGRCLVEILGRALRRVFKFKVQGECFALKWPLYHFSLAWIRTAATSIVIDSLLVTAVLVFADILKWLPGLKRPFNIRKSTGGGVEGLPGKWLDAVGVWHISALLISLIKAAEDQLLQLIRCHTVPTV